MRSEREINAFIEDLEFTCSLPSCVPGEEIMAMHAVILRWVLGEENEASIAKKNLRQSIKDADFSAQTRERVPKGDS